MFTRTAFCEECFKKGRPLKGDIYVVYGASHQEMIMLRNPTNVPLKLAGFTPHLITAEGTEPDGTVHLDLVCGMNGCGITIYKELDEYNWLINKSRKVDISRNDFIKLYEAKGVGYRLP